MATSDAKNILAGVAGSGAAGTSLAWFGPTSATAPTTATATLTGFYDAGYVSTDGVQIADNISNTQVGAYGTLNPVRVLLQSEQITFHVTFLESSTTALEVYHRQALASITPSAGAFSVSDGSATRQLYSCVFDMVDGAQHIRVYCPSVEVTDKDDVTIANSAPVSYGVTLTAYPVSGVAVKWLYVVTDDIS